MIGNTTEISPRHPVLAVLLSIVVPGLGHIYAGKLAKGLLLSIFLFVAFLNAGMMFDLSSFYATILLRVGFILFYLYVCISAFLIARKNQDYTLKKFNRWYVYLALFVAIASLSNVFITHAKNILGATTFRIVSASMAPAIEQGDFISVNTRYTTPEVGDVVIYLYPIDRNKEFTGRVAAIGGDTISIKNGSVIRNDQIEPELDVALARRRNKNSVAMERRSISEGEFFVLGDWRDNSNDSRYWGAVPVVDLVGKVRVIWFSKTPDRIGTKVQ